ncbi:MAG: Ig-like domain-containing protein [Lachnospiraceae bacterium]|nr:Ig-like domain-containing protein [Lachnospiraceae bacterium]
MLNLKKGLALVLAAATAFTFAPVANLGQSIVAEAASDNTTAITIDHNGTTAVDKTYSFASGYYKVDVEKKIADGTVPKVEYSIDGSTYTEIMPTRSDAPSVAGIVKIQQVKDALKNIHIKISDVTGLSNGTFNFSFKKVADLSDLETGSASVTAGSASDYKYSAPAGNGVPSVITVTVKNEPAPTLSSTGSTAFESVKKTNYGDTTYPFGTNNSLDADFTGITTNGTTAAVAGTDYKADGFSYQSANGFITFENLDNYTDVTKATTGKAYGHVKLVAKYGAVGEDTITVKVAKADNSGTYAEASFKVVLKDNSKHVTSYTWSAKGKTNYLTGTDAPQGIAASDLVNTNSVNLDYLVNKTVQLNVTADSTVYFTSTDTSVATVSDAGLVTALKPGSTDIKVRVASDLDTPYILHVYVTDDVTDVITAKVNGETVDSSHPINLDPSNSTAATAVKTAQIEATSAAGSPVSFQLVSTNGGSAYGDTSIATVSATGLVTAGTKVDTVYVHVSTPAAQNGKVKAGNLYIPVTINKLPQADFSVSDIKLDLKNNKTTKIEPKTSVTGIKFSYLPDADAQKAVELRGNVVTASKIGEGKITVTAAPTATTRLTEKTIKVSVLSDVTKTASDLKVASSAITVAVGKTASAGASTTASGAAITYSSDNEKVATVAADGTITAVAPGTAVITVKAAETDTVSAGLATVTVTVPQNPAKVAGLKVANKKGAKVSVSWTSQGGSISYRVYKKVGNGKWVAKNVTSNKATLSVKKGAKVQVKVKAFVKDSTGKTTWGPKATKVTKTTDKK